MRGKRLFVLAVFAAVVLSASVYIFIDTGYVVPVLMYHSLDNNYKETKLAVSPKSFAKQMEFLRKNNYNIIPLEKAIPYIQKKARPPARTIAITFDDGFQDNYQYAYPILKKYNILATIFVITNRVGNPGFLTWEELKEMSDSGLVTIGSHTKAHFWLLNSNERFLHDEVAGSKDVLEEKLKKKVNLFCYPMGAFDTRSKKAVEEAGYLCAVATNPAGVRPEDIYAMKRVRISKSSHNLFIFWFETTRLYTWFKRL